MADDIFRNPGEDSANPTRFVAGIAWYRRDQWPRWKEISIDRMCDSYDQWLEGAKEQIRKFTKDGIEVHKVDLNVEEFLAWAAKEKVQIDGMARTHYTNLALGKEQMRRLAEPEKPAPTREEIKRLNQEAKGLDLSEIWEPYLRRPRAAICPIFRETDSGPEQIGSGVLLRVGHSHFLLTAAHVADRRHTDVLLAPAKNGFINIFGLFIETKLPPSGSRNDDKIDTAVVGLSDELVSRLHDHLIFLEHEDCDLADVTEPNDVYTIIGCPARKSHTEGDTVLTSTFSLSGDGVMDGRFDQLGLDPRRHVVVQHRFKRAVHYSTMLRTQPPHPEGMSGGGIFAWDKALPKLSALRQPKLVGVVTEYHQQKNVFVGTRLHSHLMAIHRSYPSLPIVPQPQKPL